MIGRGGALLLATFVVLAVGPAQASPGDLDTSFGTGGKVTTSFGSRYDEVDGLALQPDRKIVAGGYVETSSTDSDFGLARYNPDGSLDTGFGTGGKVTTSFGSGYDWISAVVVQPDGKIVSAGRTYVSGVSEFGLARYNADGSLDTGFGAGGKVTTAIGAFAAARALALQPDGKLVAVGYRSDGTNYLFAVARYNTDGSLDTSFATGGVATTALVGFFDVGYRVALQPDGKIVVVGTSYSSGFVDSDFALVRYNPDGSLDTSFGTGGKVTTAFGPFDAARDVELQADGKIVAVGYSFDAGNTVFALARYNSDGSLDTSFGTGGKTTTAFPGTTSASPYAAAIQPNGKIVAAGYARTSPTTYPFALARYNTDGSLDTSFGTGGTLTTAIGTYNDYIVDIALQPDGKIVAGGSSQPISDPNADFALTRYLGDSHTLTVSKRGSGKGTVASAPSGIDCGSACSTQFADASSVTLTATPKSSSIFSAWSGGGCSGKKKACEVAMSAERSVKAEFSRCVVPKVKGKPLAKAKRAIKKAHCSVGRVKKSFSRKVKKGRVSAQKPKPGAKRSAGAKVSLTVSKGPRR